MSPLVLGHVVVAFMLFSNENPDEPETHVLRSRKPSLSFLVTSTEDELRGYETVLLSAARLMCRMSVCNSCYRRPAGRLLLQGRRNLTRKYVSTIQKRMRIFSLDRDVAKRRICPVLKTPCSTVGKGNATVAASRFTRGLVTPETR